MATIGIDLGTTNSAMYIKEKDLRLIQNSEAEDLTPSVVSKYKGATIVGSKALAIMEMAPEDRNRLERYLTVLQEEESSHHGENPYDDYETYIFDLRNARS